MTTAPLQTRFQLLEKPLRHPGKCAVCGSASKPVVDMGITVPGYGVVYFCVEDLTDLATVIGMVPESEVSELRLAAEQSFDDYLASRNLKVVTDEWYYNVTGAIGGFLAAAGDSGIYSGPAPDEPAGEPVSEQSAEPERKSRGKSKATEPVAEQNDNPPVDKGPASIPAGSSDGDSGEFTF